MSDPGLSTAEARTRLLADGPNRLEHGPRRTIAHMLADQLRNPFVLLLGGAAALAFGLGERVDAVAITVIVVTNAVVGAAQEHRAERALAALASMTAPRARVSRDGRAVVVPADEVVVGDLLLLHPGDLVAADAHLVHATGLALVEAALTGESVPVDKSTAPTPAGAPLAERTDHVFAGTAVAVGTARAVVVATGMRTELGKVAAMLGQARPATTPLQAQLAAVSRALLALCLAVVAVVAAAGLWNGQPWLEVLVSAVALAVAAVPEGLPAVVTIALAVGVQRMAARNVLVRRLPAVETLGCVTTICTDKTGTLTTGEMRVREHWVVPGVTELDLFEAGAACVDAELSEGEGGVGSPTEVAILLAARARGVERAALEARWPRRRERPFDSARKRMSVVRGVDGGEQTFLKGALGFAAEALAPFDPEALAVEEAFAAQGLRVLAVARGAGDEEVGLELLGLVGIADPPRASAVAAIQAAQAAGIRTTMLTGDHAVTARAIAQELGIDAVHARVTPADKLRIVRELTAAGEVVAMTGDGVTDAPAIREAHVGIAMGLAGTEVTREAASVVLADDHFASIVEGVREGRTIHENIRKTVLYLVAGNGAELALVLAAGVIGLPVPLLPTHLLWVNLVTDGLPALALVVDPPDRDAMAVPPRPPRQPLLGPAEWRLIVLSSLVESAVVLAAYVLAEPGVDPARARTVAFCTLVVSELLRAFAFRSVGRVLPEVGAFGNAGLLAVVGVSLGLQVAITEWPWARGVFHLCALSTLEWAGVFAAALVPVTVLEVGKLVRRLFHARTPA